MTDDPKPGCIHPGDPDGWCGALVALAALAAVCFTAGILAGIR